MIRVRRQLTLVFFKMKFPEFSLNCPKNTLEKDTLFPEIPVKVIFFPEFTGCFLCLLSVCRRVATQITPKYPIMTKYLEISQIFTH